MRYISWDNLSGQQLLVISIVYRLFRGEECAHWVYRTLRAIYDHEKRFLFDDFYVYSRYMEWSIWGISILNHWGWKVAISARQRRILIYKKSHSYEMKWKRMINRLMVKLVICSNNSYIIWQWSLCSLWRS